MAQRTALTWWIVFFVASLAISCQHESTLPYYNAASFDPIFVSGLQDIESQVPHQIADFTFVDQDSNIITQKNIEGKIHVANFTFTSCISICPKMTNEMKKVCDAFKSDNDVIILSFSVTPWIDSVARIRDYAQDHQINSNMWHLLTGKKSEIYKLARTSYFAEQDLGFTKDSTEFLHTEHFLLVDRNKRIRGIYNGTLALETEQLIKDIELLKKE